MPAPKMTKEHFELLAETIANLDYAEHSADGRFGIISKPALVAALADMCASTNGNFDRGRFETACRTPNYRAPKNVTRY